MMGDEKVCLYFEREKQYGKSKNLGDI